MTQERVRRGTAVLVVVLAALAVGALARAPMDPPGADDAMLRLSWRWRPDAAEICRPRTQAELDALPVHMRAPEVCERERLVHRLIVQLGTGTADTVRVVPGGAKGDRPVYVLRDFPVRPGSHRVRVRLIRDGVATPVLALDTLLRMEAGTVGLVTIAPDGRQLIIRQPL